MAYNWIVYDTDAAGVMSTADKENNVEIIYSILTTEYHWTLEAICGALGSMEMESSFNPGQWEIGHKPDPVPPLGYGFGYGYGLIQWTTPNYPDYPNPYLNYCGLNGIDRLDGTEQVKYLNTGITSSDLWGWISTAEYPISFDEYVKNTDAPATLASVWFHNLERPPAGDTTEPYRRERAEYWYTWLSGKPPIPPSPKKIRKGMPLWMYLKIF